MLIHIYIALLIHNMLLKVIVPHGLHHQQRQQRWYWYQFTNLIHDLLCKTGDQEHKLIGCVQWSYVDHRSDIDIALLILFLVCYTIRGWLTQTPSRDVVSVIKGEALLTIGYTIFGNKSYSYIHSQISVHRKHEIIEQSGI